MRFEYFLSLLKNSLFIIGNSSSGIIEAPYYGIPTINIGSRQQNRFRNKEIINCNYEKPGILNAIKLAAKTRVEKLQLFGKGDSDKLFFRIISGNEIWEINKQKIFKDIEKAV